MRHRLPTYLLSGPDGKPQRARSISARLRVIQAEITDQAPLVRRQHVRATRYPLRRSLSLLSRSPALNTGLRCDH